jgi:hypothetical protein
MAIYEDQPDDTQTNDPLAIWVMNQVNKWREHRDDNYLKRWAEYYRLWRGFWDPQDQNKEAERSRLIAPALQQAVDMTVSEMEEATFGRGAWFDVSDDYLDQEKEDVIKARDTLLCDFEEMDVPAAVSESYLNGALYGTGIAKIMMGRVREYEFTPEGQAVETMRFRVWVEPIEPKNFVIDPGARTVDDALGCAHEIIVPRHKILQKQREGFYFNNYVGAWDGTEGNSFSEAGKVLVRENDKSDTVFITEYHGLVPRNLLDMEEPEVVMPGEVGDDEKYTEEDGEMVEAIVTIANKGILLRAVENPYMMKDRAIVAYPHDTVPGRFWGRGVSEKGYNPQKALDAELRARIDALAYLTYPTLGADATRLPRGLDLKIKPGRLFLTNGRPSEILEPIVFGNLNPATFEQSGDLERMVQMGTGAMDSATGTDSNPRNNTASGMSMIQGGFIKRSKRAMRNVETKFLDKIIQKSLWRYMEFDPERYPKDFKFQVNSTMGIMAREFEQATLTQMLQVIPPESPIFPAVIKGIIENSASANKAELMGALKAMMTPDPQAEQKKQLMEMLQFQGLKAEVEEKQEKANLARAQAEAAMANARLLMVKADLEDEKVEIAASNTVIANKKTENDLIKTKIQTAESMMSMQHEEKKMAHEEKMMSKELEFGEAKNEQKLRHGDESHQQKMKQQKDKAKLKPKGNKK